jgi:hypothetical protein
MPICPMCHSALTEDLNVRPSILPDSLWRCQICGDVWSERSTVLPLDPPHVINADAPPRRKRMTGRRRSCAGRTT